MTKLEEIEQEIKKLESKENITYDMVHKLADLYIVRKYMAGGGSTSMMPEPAPASSLTPPGIIK